MKNYCVYFNDGDVICGTDRHTWCNFSSLNKAEEACRQIVTSGAKSLANGKKYKGYQAEIVDTNTGEVVKTFNRIR